MAATMNAAATKKASASKKKAPATNQGAKAKAASTTKVSAAKKVDTTKKLGLASSATRSALVDVTETLIREQGFAAITSRILAAKAGIKPQLIHYYFNSVDDLYVEVFRRGAEADLARLTAALEADQPLRAMWKLSSDPKATRFVTEFMAIANHNETVRAEITRYAETRREVQAEVVSRHLAARGVTPRIPPMVIAVLMENVARGLVLESALSISLGHDEVEIFLEGVLQRFEESGDAIEAVEAQLAPKSGGRVRSKTAVERAPGRTARRRG